MAHSSLRTRILVMTALPAFLAALVIGGYTLVHRMMEVRADTAHRQNPPGRRKAREAFSFTDP